MAILEYLPLIFGVITFVGIVSLFWCTEQCKGWKSIMVAAVLTVGGVGLGYTLREFIFWCLGWFGK